jgi:hypothetical protein
MPVKTAQQNRYAWRLRHAGRRATGRVRQKMDHQSHNPALGRGIHAPAATQTQMSTTY